MTRLFPTLARTLVVAVAVTACRSGDSLTSPLMATGSVPASARAPDSKDLCKSGGYVNYTRPDHTTFANQGDCVSFAAQGGTLVAVVAVPALPVITSLTNEGSVDQCATTGRVHPLFTAVFSGGTATFGYDFEPAVPVTSGVQFAYGTVSRSTYTLTVSNAAGSVTRTITPFPDISYVVGCGADGGAPPL
ncbi:MAG: Curculin domain protein (mannose-binding) lectin [Gemmatimonadetes bacterium]|nr:Curculin domain protein (mannose-binding) lectin [Gemmatimonadota bacterium]